MIKEIFKNGGKKLREIIYKKLAQKASTQEEIAVVEMELAMMKRWGDEKRFLFLHELTKQSLVLCENSSKRKLRLIKVY